MLEADISRVYAQIETRRLDVLRWEAESPTPNPDCNQPGGEQCALGKLNQALALLYLGSDAHAIATANSEIEEAVSSLGNQPNLTAERGEEIPGGAAGPRPFHFMRAGFLYRAVRLFGSAGTKATQRLTPANETAIVGLFWNWANVDCRLSNTGADQLWTWGSENIHAQIDATCWQAADLFRSDTRFATRGYQDGSTAGVQYAAWTGFVKSYIRARARWGLIEFFSPTYSRYTLGNFYGYADFSDDPELKRLAHEFLDMWWAEWAQEQIGGVFGGASARVYPQLVGTGSPMDGISWMYFGLGEKREARAPGLTPATMGTYVPSPAIIDLALDAQGRGAYEIDARAPGIVPNPAGRGAERGGSVDPAIPAVLLVTYVTPDFIMGSPVVAKRPATDWNPASSQNHCAGVVLAGDPQARIVAYSQSIKGANYYNALWAMQSKATQIIQKAPKGYSSNAGDMRVWFGSPLQKVERDGWVFVAGSAFVAVHPVFGGYHWDPIEARWLVLNDSASPVIIQAARKNDYADFAAFQSAVLGTMLVQNGASMSFRGLGGAGTLTWDESAGSLGAINGIPVDIGSSPGFRSPFMHQAAGSGQIRIDKADRSETLDF
ncbi:MAG: hypothetical protein ABSC92_08895 [Rhizomicrobium sp.]